MSKPPGDHFVSASHIVTARFTRTGSGAGRARHRRRARSVAPAGELRLDRFTSRRWRISPRSGRSSPPRSWPSRTPSRRTSAQARRLRGHALRRPEDRLVQGGRRGGPSSARSSSSSRPSSSRSGTGRRAAFPRFGAASREPELLKCGPGAVSMRSSTDRRRTTTRSSTAVRERHFRGGGRGLLPVADECGRADLTSEARGARVHQAVAPS